MNKGGMGVESMGGTKDYSGESAIKSFRKRKGKDAALAVSWWLFSIHAVIRESG